MKRADVRKIPKFPNVNPGTWRCSCCSKMVDRITNSIKVNYHYHQLSSIICRDCFEKGDPNHNPYMLCQNQMVPPEKYPEGFDYWKLQVKAQLVKKLGYYTVTGFFEGFNWVPAYMEGQRPAITVNRIIKKYEGRVE